MKSQQLHILIRGTTWLGDAVMTIPALRRARACFPSAHICLLTPPATASLFDHAGLVDEVLCYHRKERGVSEFLRTINDLRRRRFDLAILFQNAFEAALLACLAGIPARVGHFAQGRGWLLTAGTAASIERKHQIDAYVELVDLALRSITEIRSLDAPAVAGVSSVSSISSISRAFAPAPRITASPGQLQAAAKLLGEHRVSPDNRALVALNVGAVNSRAKRWPAERYAELADRLMAEFRASVLLIGAPAEREIADRILARMRVSGAVNLAGETDLPTLIGLLSRCDLVVSNDTGSAHVAAALGRPTLTIFGPTNEFETAPRGERAEIVRAAGIECARCMLRDCPIDHRCMWQITADHLIARARPHLNNI